MRRTRAKKALSTLRLHWSLLTVLVVSILIGLLNFEGNWFHSTYLQFRKYPYQERAQQLLSQGRIAEAEAELVKCLEVDPADTKVRTRYMALLFEQGRYVEVVRQAEIVLQQAPGSYSALRHRGLALKSLGKDEEASRDFERAATLKGLSEEDRTFVLLSAAEITIQQQEYAQALGILDNLARTTPDDYRLEKRRGFVLEQLDRLSEAVSACQSALNLAPDDNSRFESYRALAEVLRKTGEMESSRNALLGALTLRPNASELSLIHL